MGLISAPIYYSACSLGVRAGRHGCVAAGDLAGPPRHSVPVRRLGPGKAGACVALPGGRGVPPRVPASGLGAGGALELGVRAEHVSTGGGLAGRAEVVEGLGEPDFCNARLDGGSRAPDEDGRGRASTGGGAVAARVQSGQAPPSH